MAVDSQRLKLLRVAKLRSLVSKEFDIEDLDIKAFEDGAIGFAGSSGFVLVESNVQSSLGAALASALQQEATSLTVLAAEHAGHIARQASYFNFEISVYEVSGDTVSAAPPAAFDGISELDPAAEQFRELLKDSGAEVVEEHGVLTGEIMGLEVARVVGDGEDAHLEVGVGRNDREAFSMLYQHMSADEALAKVVVTVSEQRRPGARNHALNLMAVERWLRAILLRNPSLVAAEQLDPLPPLFKRPFVDSAGPAAAVGTDQSGQPIVVVCSVGVDLSLVPIAADYFASSGSDGLLCVVVPKRDVYRSTSAILGLLHQPYRVVEISDQWRELLGGPTAVI